MRRVAAYVSIDTIKNEQLPKLKWTENDGVHIGEMLLRDVKLTIEIKPSHKVLCHAQLVNSFGDIEEQVTTDDVTDIEKLLKKVKGMDLPIRTSFISEKILNIAHRIASTSEDDKLVNNLLDKVVDKIEKSPIMMGNKFDKSQNRIRTYKWGEDEDVLTFEIRVDGIKYDCHFKSIDNKTGQVVADKEVTTTDPDNEFRKFKTSIRRTEESALPDPMARHYVEQRMTGGKEGKKLPFMGYESENVKAHTK